MGRGAGHVATAAALLEAAGVVELIDDGYVTIDDDPAAFIAACRTLRHWDREPTVHAT